MSAPPGIAIVGGGFAGTMLAVHMAARAQQPLAVTIYDRAGAFTRGVAYGTQNPHHLLNVVAGRMGAFPDKLDDFHRWLRGNGHAAGADAFMPRMIYGRYIASLFEAAKKNPNVTINTVKAEVVDVEATAQGVSLTLADGTKHAASRVVLALGSLKTHQPRISGTLSQPERYIGNVWAPPPGSILMRSQFNAHDEPILIIGTGLTMIDMMLSLRDEGYQGNIIAVSRGGLLPQPHVLGARAHPRFLTPSNAPKTAFGLLRAIRKEAKANNWRAVIDSLRADTPALWAALPERERKKLRRVLSFWGVHRHRMPPESASMIERETRAGTLSIVKAHIREIRDAKDGLTVALRRKGEREVTEMRVGHVLNCAGPTTDIARADSVLLEAMLKKGVIQAGPLNWGIAAERDGRVKGNAGGRVFALGPLLTGERLETVAVPELRAQAQEVATALLAL